MQSAYSCCILDACFKVQVLYSLYRICIFRTSSAFPNITKSEVRIKIAVLGRAVAQRLDAGFPPRRPGFACGQHVGFVVDKAALEQVFSEYFGFPRQSFHRFLHRHNHPGLTQ
jgi:hypothetical protein